jgi:hypothetical protein
MSQWCSHYGKRKHRMKLSLQEKLVWSQLFALVKLSFPVSRFMPYYGEMGHSHPLIT